MRCGVTERGGREIEVHETIEVRELEGRKIGGLGEASIRGVFL